MSDEIKLNGSSKEFLERFYKMEERLSNHLDNDEEYKEDMHSYMQKIDAFIQQEYVPLKTKVDKHNAIFTVIGSVLMATIVALIGWGVSHFG